MELAAMLVIAFVLLLLVMMWRPYRGRRRTPEDALDSEALRKEQEKAIDDAVYHGDRWNIPPRGR